MEIPKRTNSEAAQAVLSAIESAYEVRHHPWASALLVEVIRKPEALLTLQNIADENRRETSAE